MADRQRVVQVLNNLFSNAARHSPESSPIRVDAARDGVHVAISVADEGRGVPPEQLPHLFRKHAGAAGAGRRAGGRGLRPGPRHLQGPGGGPRRPHLGRERRGGPGHAIHLHAARGRGGRRRRRRRPGPEPLPDASANRGRRRAFSSWTTTRRCCATCGTPLAAAGYSPVVTGDPRELSRIIRKERPRLVLLDLLLPGTDGIKLMAQVPELADSTDHLHLGLWPGRDESPGRWRWAPSTTSSSPSRRRS